MLRPACRQVVSVSANRVGVVVEAASRQLFEEIEQELPLAEGVHEDAPSAADGAPMSRPKVPSQSR